jgi:hypothetical protein
VGQPLKSCGGSKEDEHSNRPKQNKMILPLMQGKRDKRRNNDRKPLFIYSALIAIPNRSRMRMRIMQPKCSRG